MLMLDGHEPVLDLGVRPSFASLFSGKLEVGHVDLSGLDICTDRQGERLQELARSLHGYAIAKRIKDASEDGLQIEDGSLYPSLNRMLVKGWLAAEWGISENNRKARFYRLTVEGRKQLERESAEFDRLVRSIQRVLRTV